VTKVLNDLLFFDAVEAVAFFLCSIYSMRASSSTWVAKVYSG
jgi:hypothetical protein